MRRLSWIWMLVVLGGCEAGPSEDGRDEVFLSDGKADTGGIVEGSREAQGVLRVANETGEAELRSEAGLATRAAESIAAYRLGDDEAEGTSDDQRFDSLAELDAVPWVGPKAFAALLARATALGYLASTPAPGPGGLSCDPLADLGCAETCSKKSGCGRALTGTWRARTPIPDGYAALGLRADGGFVAFTHGGSAVEGGWSSDSAGSAGILTFTSTTERRFRVRLESGEVKLSFLEVDPAGQPVAPPVAFSLERTTVGFCLAADDCSRQPLPLPVGRGAWSCQTNACVFQLDPACVEDPTTEVLQPISLSGAPAGRRNHSAVWTGTEMLVWGGAIEVGGKLTDTATGGRYRPDTDAWRSMSDIDAPAARSDAVAAWTGTEVAIFGGQARLSGGARVLTDGGLYDPAKDQWRPIPSYPGLGALPTRAFFTGSELIFWIDSLQGGVRFDPTTATFTAIPSAKPDWALSDQRIAGEVVAWTGSELLTYFTLVDRSSGYGPNDHCRRFDPKQASWRGCSDDGGPYAYPYGGLVGDQLLAFQPTSGGGGLGWSRATIQGASYDLLADVWRPTAEGPSTNYYDLRVAGAREAILCRNLIAYNSPAVGTACVRYDPARQTWSDERLIAPKDHLYGASLLWAGDQLLLWGGETRDVVSGFEIQQPASAEGRRWRPPVCQ